MDQIKTVSEIRQKIYQAENELDAEVRELNKERKEQQKLFTPSVIFWIISFVIMVVSLFYKELYLEQYSDDWRFFSAIHMMTALICIGGIGIHILRNQKVFDEDISLIDQYLKVVPVLPKDDRVYANSREEYERVLERFKEYILLSRSLYFFGVIVMITIFFIWNITKYFLSPDALVIPLTADVGWNTTANQIYYPGLLILGLSMISSVIIRESTKSSAAFFVLILQLGSIMNQMSKKTHELKAV